MTVYEAPTPELEKLHEELGYYPKPDDFEPVPDFPEGHYHHGRPRCQGWNAYRGRQCMGLAMVSNGLNAKGKIFDKCGRHGGKSLRGLEHPNYKNARYTYLLPDRLMYQVEQLAGTDIMDLRERAELLELRIMEIVSNLDDAGSFEIFHMLQEKMDEYEKYVKLARTASSNRQADYTQRAAAALNEVSRLIKLGNDDREKWKEISDITEQIRKLADTEQKQIKTKEIAVMADRVVIFATAMASIFRDALKGLTSIDDGERNHVITVVDKQVELLLLGDHAEAIDG